MDSALNPREIQSRIRAGESLTAVAEAAGLPEDKIAPFAGPVLAEREHIATVARTGLVRRRGDATAHRSLGKVIVERLKTRRLDADLIVWDAYRLPDRTWRVVALLEQGDFIREAWFTYDAQGRFNIAANADARWLIGEDPPPGEQAPDSENTVDLNDELALIRATTEQERDNGQEQLAEAIDFGLPAEYDDVEFSEVDGLYDIAGPKQNQLDDLYETLSGINEDSVQIYAGLNDPVIEPDTSVPLPDNELLSDVSELLEAPPELADEAEDNLMEQTTPVPEIGESDNPAEDPYSQDETEDSADSADSALLETDVPETPTTEDKPKRSRRRRASVPAWDDILFGGPPRKD